MVNCTNGTLVFCIIGDKERQGQTVKQIQALTHDPLWAMKNQNERKCPNSTQFNFFASHLTAFERTFFWDGPQRIWGHTRIDSGL
jgi:hypothetical protein